MGRPPGTAAMAGFTVETSGGRPTGTTAPVGYDVSKGRPQGTTVAQALGKALDNQ